MRKVLPLKPLRRPKQPFDSKKYQVAITDHNLNLAFDNSYQANIITIVSSGQIIIANETACKLLGYSQKELLTKRRADIFDIKESTFKNMLKQRTLTGHSKCLATAIRKNGQLVPAEITSAVFIGDKGIKTAITTIADMSLSTSKQKKIDTEKDKIVAGNISLAKSKQKKIDTKKEKIVVANILLAQAKSDARLAENNEWIKYIAKTSYDVMWDWDISTGQIYVGDSITEVFGYSVKDNLASFKDFCKCLLKEEKAAVKKKLLKALASDKKNWKDTYMFRRHDGSVASTTSRASIIRNEKGKAIRLIGAIQDVSRLQELEKDLEDQIAKQDEQGEKYLLAAQLSFDVMWEWNLLTNEVFIGEGFEELFGYAIKNNKGNIVTDWTNYMHPDDKMAIEKKLQDTIRSTAMYWEQAYRVIRANGSIAKVFARARIIRNAEGKAYKMIGALQDVSRQNELEEKLDQEIRSKEKQITEAMEEATETERSNIGRELHDNVNQLLGVSKLYLDLAKRGGDKSEMYIGRSSQYTLSAIEEIRKLTKGLTTEIIKNLGLCEAINNICIDTMEVNSVRISHTLEDFIEENVKEKFKMNIFRIVQEQLNNILKHAKATKVLIDLTQDNDTIRLAISDDGVGFDTRQKQKGIGIVNIKRRAASYHGTAEFISQPGEGCFLKVTFPIKDAQVNKN